MKIVIVGGHLSPALGVIDALPASDSVVFIGRKFALEGDKTPSLEYEEIRRRQITFKALTTARIQRKFTSKTFPSLAKLPIGLYQAVTYLREESPDAVLSFGGYLSLPVGYAAKMLGIPLIIHEQTLQAGLANKILGKIADKVCISWETSSQFFPKNKVVVTGNPLKEFQTGNFTFSFKKNDQSIPLIYITGGSTGSHAINELVGESLSDMLTKYRVIHQTGDSRQYKDYDLLIKKREELPKELQNRYMVEKFISSDSVGGVFKEADIVVSRSGINTVSELMYFGKPALLIPLPYGQRNEQATNARFLQNIGLGLVLPQETATPAIFQKSIDQLVKNKEEYLAHAKEARQILHPRAAHEIIHTLSYVVNKKSSQKR
jgi:UDP-N-acetylglucosamine--N-acetylmuramyl-(pentapeptide) pyrophosphoryl-undecaprenol N-acetylglucosamine transferase